MSAPAEVPQSDPGGAALAMLRALVHDLRSTLTGTRGFLELLTAFGPGTAGYDAAWIDEALQSSDRALAQLAAASEVARAAREGSPVAAEIDLAARLAVRLTAFAAGTAAERLEFDPPLSAPRVVAPAALLDRLLEFFLAPAAAGGRWRLELDSDPGPPGAARLRLALAAGPEPTPSERERAFCRLAAVLLAAEFTQSVPPAVWSRTLRLPLAGGDRPQRPT